jgi:hypothetical protein
MKDDGCITHLMLDEFIMRISVDSNGIWSEVIKAWRLRRFDFDLKYNREVGSTSTIVLPMSNAILRFSLPPCMGEIDEILGNHREQSKRKKMTWELTLILVRLFLSSLLRSQKKMGFRQRHLN